MRKKRNVFMLSVGLLVALDLICSADLWAIDDIVYEIKVEGPQFQKPKTPQQLETERQKKRIEDARKAGEAAAQLMKQNYKVLDKPNFPTAYYYYLEDLKVIADKGLAPERANLFQDLELMNSQDVYIYFDSNDYYQLR